MLSADAKISSKQFSFAVACTIQSSVLLTALFIDMAKQDSWLIIIVGMVLTLPLIMIYSKIMSSFPDKNFFQIMDIVFGKVIGKIFAAFYTFFILTLTTLNLHDIGTFINASIMPKTPLIVIVIVIMLVASYAVKGDLSVVVKYGAAFMIIVLIVFITALLLTVDIVDLKNYLPMFDQPVIKYVQGSQTVVAIPFTEIFIFMMINPNIIVKPKKIKKFFTIGFLIGAFTLLLVVLSSIALLGNSLELFTLPPFEMFTLIDITSALSRMEILSVLAIMILLIFKIGIFFYILLIAIKQLFNLSDYKPLTYGIGIIIALYSTFIYSSVMKHVFYAGHITIFLWLIFELVIPVLLIFGIIIKIKKGKLKNVNLSENIEENKGPSNNSHTPQAKNPPGDEIVQNASTKNNVSMSEDNNKNETKANESSSNNEDTESINHSAKQNIQNDVNHSKDNNNVTKSNESSSGNGDTGSINHSAKQNIHNDVNHSEDNNNVTKNNESSSNRKQAGNNGDFNKEPSQQLRNDKKFNYNAKSNNIFEEVIYYKKD